MTDAAEARGGDGVRYVLFANGKVAREFLEGIAAADRLPVLVVLNRPEKQRQADEIRAACELHRIAVAEWSPQTRERLLEMLRGDPALWLLSVYFGHVLDAELLDAAAGRAVNLHASLLPWCRGAHTNVWPLVEGCPAGVTLHGMVARVDSGPVLAQAEVPVEPWDTGGSLYAKLEAAGLALLRDAWPGAVLAAWPGAPQAEGGSSHRVAELARLESYALDGRPEAREFFDLLRARSFPPHRGLIVEVDGRRVEAVVTLKEVAD